MAQSDEEAIFNAAREIADPIARRQYIEQACRDNPALEPRILALLRVYDDDTSFLQSCDVGMGPTPLGPEAGTLIGHFKLIKPIGEGGMGVVYQAEQLEPIRRQVALKIIKSSVDSQHILARFEAERQALALMDHPNIAKVFDAGQSPPAASGRLPRPYFVMELIDGDAITKFCDRERLNVRQRLELFIPVCDAVQHAHQKGIIHRDLKPSNVLVALRDGQPTPKVIDFGVAKAMGPKLTDQTLVTGIGHLVGTLPYMSPEQAQSDQQDVDTRSDIYSLGVLLYELLTGSTPFDRKRFRDGAWVEMLRMLRDEEPPKPSDRLGDTDELSSIAASRGVEPKKLSGLIRGDLDWIVMKSLEKDRARRYATANGLARDIQRFLDEEPVHACPPSAGYRLRKFARRHKVGLAASLTIGLVLIAAVIATSWQAVRASRAEWQSNQALAQTVREKDRADQEAAIAFAVNEFLRKDLLDQADIANQPGDQARDRNITVRELLDRAAQRIESKFRDQPRTEAAIRQTVGDVYRALAEYENAEKHLRRAVELSAAHWGPRHHETLESMKLLGNTLSERGNYAEAETYYTQVLDIRRDDLGPDHLGTLTSMCDLGLLYVQMGRYDQAEKLLEPAVAARTEKLGPDDLRTLEGAYGLAALNYAQRRYDRAAILFKQISDGFKRRLGPDHPHTLTATASLGASYMGLGDFDKAEKTLREILEMQKAKLGDGNPEIFNTMQNLAQVLQELKRFDESESLYRAIITGRRLKQGPDHRDTLRAMQNFATYYVDRGQYDRAEALYKETLAVQRAKLGHDHHEAIVVLHNLGMLYRRRGQLDQSEKFFVEALASARKTLTFGHSDTQSIIANLAMVHYLRGMPQSAEPTLRELLTFLDSLPDRPPAAYGNALSNLALILLAEKKFAEAESLARRCLELRTKTAPDRWSTFLAKSILGGALLGQRKYTEAEPLLIDGYEGLKKRESAIHITARFHVADALDRIVQLYEQWGKSDRASEWRKKRDSSPG